MVVVVVVVGGAPPGALEPGVAAAAVGSVAGGINDVCAVATVAMAAQARAHRRSGYHLAARRGQMFGCERN